MECAKGASAGSRPAVAQTVVWPRCFPVRSVRELPGRAVLLNVCWRRDWSSFLFAFWSEQLFSGFRRVLGRAPWGGGMAVVVGDVRPAPWVRWGPIKRRICIPPSRGSPDCGCRGPIIYCDPAGRSLLPRCGHRRDQRQLQPRALQPGATAARGPPRAALAGPGEGGEGGPEGRPPRVGRAGKLRRLA